MTKLLSGIVVGTPITLNQWNLDAGHGLISGDFVGDHPDPGWEPAELVGGRFLILLFNGKKIVACGKAYFTEVSVHNHPSKPLEVHAAFKSDDKWVFIG